MKRITISAALLLCVAAIRINDRTYDLLSTLAHALQRIAGCLQWSLDAPLERYWIQLRTARDMLPTPNSPTTFATRWREAVERVSNYGDAALSFVLIATAVYCLLATAGDLTTAYEAHLIAQWKEGAK